MTTTSWPPLTTTFTPPSSCFGTFTASLRPGVDTTAYDIWMVEPTAGCLPPNPYTVLEYSPGVCPSGRTIALAYSFMGGSASATTVGCCPTGFSVPYSFPNYCVSTIFSGTTLAAHSGSQTASTNFLVSFSTPIGVTAICPAVAWASSDLSKFPSTIAASLLENMAQIPLTIYKFNDPLSGNISAITTTVVPAPQTSSLSSSKSAAAASSTTATSAIANVPGSNTPTSSNSNLAKILIGVLVPVCIIAISLALFFFIRYRRSQQAVRKATALRSAEKDQSKAELDATNPGPLNKPVVESGGGDYYYRPHELHATTIIPHELDATSGVRQELKA